jgi:twinkle protein
LVHRNYEQKNTKVKVLKVKFQNLGENGAEALFNWEPKSGCYIPAESDVQEKEELPWE